MNPSTEPMQGLRRHKLLSKEIEQKLPPLYSQENEKDPKIIVKFFCPYSQWRWYAIEGEWTDEDGCPVRETKKQATDFTFFGYVEGDEKEMGYFSYNEIVKATINLCGFIVPSIERDLYFHDIPLSEIKKPEVEA